MQKLKHIAAALALTSLSLTAAASDFGTWTGAEANKKVGQFTFFLGAGYRLQNNLASTDRVDATFGVSYKPLSFLKLAAGYTYIYAYSTEKRRPHYDEYEQGNEDGTSTWMKELDGYNINKPYWRSKNRFNFDVSGNVDIGRLNISLRERYQYTAMGSASYTREKYRYNEVTGEALLKETDRKHKASKNNHRLRSQLKAEYNIRKCRFTPYAQLELFNELDGAMRLGKTRVGAGTEYKINKANRISIGYIYQDERDADMGETQHVIDISYKFKF